MSDFLRIRLIASIWLKLQLNAKCPTELKDVQANDTTGGKVVMQMESSLFLSSIKLILQAFPPLAVTY